MSVFTWSKACKALPEELEKLEQQEEHLFMTVIDLRRRIHAARMELSDLPKTRPVTGKSLGTTCYFCCESISDQALICRHCKRPSIANQAAFATLERFVQTSIQKLVGAK